MCTSNPQSVIYNLESAIDWWAMNSIPRCVCPALLMICVACAAEQPGRVQVSLNGEWAVEEGIEAEELPQRLSHAVAVPGLTNQARPAFPDVDNYETHEFVWTMKRYGILPQTEVCEGLGRTRQKRKYFWYQRAFTPPARKERAELVVHKAQFGTAVWLNGKKIGEQLACFTAGHFDLTGAINWTGGNQLVIRIGAHPGVLPDWAFWGSDGEKGPWTPGIYDEVELRLADNPTIEEIQIAPRIATSQAVVQTRVKNYGPAREVELVQKLRAWKDGRDVGQPVRQKIQLAENEEKVIEQTLAVPEAVLWSPESPFLYAVETSTGGDSCLTRFGMREFRFDSASRRAMLNGKTCYLRGASMTVHRFFGDPQCGALPWDDAWVRKFLGEIPRRFHWNAFRVCIGPVPRRWLDIADEEGLLLQYEFPIWSDREPNRHKLWKEEDIAGQLRQFMRDNWNHPSVALWDASNETHLDYLGKKLIPELRKLDLSNRPWENGYNQPEGSDDPWEDHPYLYISHVFGKPPYFQITDLEKMAGRQPPKGWKSDHAAIINEYDWLWLHRDGTPTALSKKVFDNLLGPDATPPQRLALNAYLLAGITEFWRAYRQYAGVLYLAYLDADLPYAFTCDNFRDVKRLELDPQFEDYMTQAFKPLGVYVNFWQAKLRKGEGRTYRVMLVNDTYDAAEIQLSLGWQTADGKPAAPESAKTIAIAPLGQASCDVDLAAPADPGAYVLTAKALWPGKPWSPTISRRKATCE